MLWLKGLAYIIFCCCRLHQNFPWLTTELCLWNTLSKKQTVSQVVLWSIVENCGRICSLLWTLEARSVPGTDEGTAYARSVRLHSWYSIIPWVQANWNINYPRKPGCFLLVLQLLWQGWEMHGPLDVVALQVPSVPATLGKSQRWCEFNIWRAIGSPFFHWNVSKCNRTTMMIFVMHYFDRTKEKLRSAVNKMLV